MYGELIPLGGGDPIPLLKRTISIGRRDSNDITLQFENISGHHCQLTINYGYWYVKDLNSRNGVKVNSVRIAAEKRLDPGDILSIAKHRFEVRYSPADLGAIGPPPDDETTSAIFGKSLLERAGLSKKKSIEEMAEEDDYIQIRRDAEKEEARRQKGKKPS
jgi:adenylate cyclase